MDNSSYIQTILNAFSSMDITALRAYLKDEYYYHDTTKEIFLNEIDRFFRRRKNADDSKLIIYGGKCNGKNCPNYGMKGYRFVGNHSRTYLDLIFDTEKDDIKDIVSCGKFRTDVRVKNLKYKATIEINKDDKVTFIKTAEYLAKLNAATTAWKEIITTPPRVINFDDLSYWVDKHSVADELIGSYDSFNPVMKWTPFSLIYSELKEIRHYLAQSIDEIITANTCIYNINTEPDLIEWLLTYEDIGQGAPFHLKHAFNKERDHYWWNYQTPIHFKDVIFSQALDFLEYYQKHYKAIFEKYSTYTDEEISISYNYCASKEETKNLYSLKFHIQNRKNLEAAGIHVPFFIDRNDE